MFRRSIGQRLFWGQDVRSLCGEFRNNLINGKRLPGSNVDPSVPKAPMKLQLWSPADDVVIGEMTESSRKDVDDAACAARAAYSQWSRLTPAARGSYLRRIADEIRASSRALATAEAISCGMPISDAFVSVESCASTFDAFSGISLLNTGDLLPPFGDRGEYQAFVRREPLGVVGIITPYNYPLEMGVWKMAPALAAGNAVVWKPPELAPFSAGLLSDIFVRCGVPPGVINVVHGRSHVGEAIARSSNVDLVAFTGSIKAGVAVQVAAATSNLKRCQLELGGNAALVVDQGFDVQEAADIAMACFSNAGQSCTSVRRIIVPQALERPFLEAVVARIEQRTLGHPLDPKVAQGPLITAQHLENVLTRVKESLKRGEADLVCGLFKPQFPAGHFLSPTLLTRCDPVSPLFQQELFGPVMCVTTYRTLDEAVWLANSTNNGLSANVLSNDIDVAEVLSRELRAGTVWVNSADAMNGTTPFGGLRQSGYGKDLGVHSLDGYSNMKSVIKHTRRIFGQSKP